MLIANSNIIEVYILIADFSIDAYYIFLFLSVIINF